MRIDNLILTSPVFLAPLAGFTDLPFRLLCRKYGAGLCFSEMISCHGLVFGQSKTIAMLNTVPEERPVAFQLFGSVPDIMGEAAAILSDRPIDLIDINMGCPAKKVIKKGAGAALMKTPDLAARIIRQVTDNSRVPVTVKIRSGLNHEKIIADDFARMAEDYGAQAVTVHARTLSAGFSGPPDRGVISMVKKRVSIPVIGNGDVLSYEDGITMMKETGCDGVMIGRGALGRPWVFQPNAPTCPPLMFRLKALREHLGHIGRRQAENIAFAAAKNHAGKYFKGLPGSAAIRKRIYEAKNFNALCELADSLALEFY